MIFATKALKWHRISFSVSESFSFSASRSCLVRSTYSSKVLLRECVSLSRPPLALKNKNIKLYAKYTSLKKKTKKKHPILISFSLIDLTIANTEFKVSFSLSLFPCYIKKNSESKQISKRYFSQLPHPSTELDLTLGVIVNEKLQFQKHNKLINDTSL